MVSILHPVTSVFTTSMIADDPPRIRLKLLEYFGKAEYRGVNIKYFSSANNRSLVNAYIKGDYDVIEGDVTALKPSSFQRQAVMYTAPGSKVSSNSLSFRQWLSLVVVNGRGIKVDLKSEESVAPAIADLRYVYSQNSQLRHIPLIISGNILNGPNWAKAQFTAIDPIGGILIDSLQGFPFTMLALGWTTAVDHSPDGANKYDWTCIKDMYDVATRLMTSDPDLQLTFNVRVDFAASSIAALRWLTEMTGGSVSLQIGDDTPTGDAYLSAADYNVIRTQLSPSKVFYEMSIKTHMIDDNALTVDGEFGMDRWQVIRYHSNGELVYLGTASLIMQHAVVISRANDILANINVPVVIETVIEFIKTFDGIPSYVELCTRANIGIIAESVSGICVHLSSSGEMNVRSRAIPGVDIDVKSTLDSDFRTSTTSVKNTPEKLAAAAAAAEDASSRPSLCFAIRLEDSGVEVKATAMRYLRCDRAHSARPYDEVARDVDEFADRRSASASMKTITTATGRRAILSAGGENGFIVVEHFRLNYKHANET